MSVGDKNVGGNGSASSAYRKGVDAIADPPIASPADTSFAIDAVP